MEGVHLPVAGVECRLETLAGRINRGMMKRVIKGCGRLEGRVSIRLRLEQ